MLELEWMKRCDGTLSEQRAYYKNTTRFNGVVDWSGGRSYLAASRMICSSGRPRKAQRLIMNSQPGSTVNVHRRRRMDELNAWVKQRREAALEPGLPIVDPHHHLWDDERGRYLLH